MTNANMTSVTVTAEIEQCDAEARAWAMAAALGQGCTAKALELAGSWYVVTSGTGEGWDYAYEAGDVDPDIVSAKGWDYSAWCSGVSPCDDLEAAVDYYMQTGRQLGAPGGCGGSLSKEQVQALLIARKVTS